MTPSLSSLEAPPPSSEPCDGYDDTRGALSRLLSRAVAALVRPDAVPCMASVGPHVDGSCGASAPDPSTAALELLRLAQLERDPARLAALVMGAKALLEQSSKAKKSTCASRAAGENGFVSLPVHPTWPSLEGPITRE